MRKVWQILSIVLIAAGLVLCTLLNTLPKFIELLAVSAAMIAFATYTNKRGSKLFLVIASLALICYLTVSTVLNVVSLFNLPQYILITWLTVVKLLMAALPGMVTLLGNLIVLVLCITKGKVTADKLETLE